MSLQVYCLFLQALNPGISSINSRLNLPPEENFGNLLNLLQQEPYLKLNTNKLLDRCSPLKNLLCKNYFHEVVLNVIQSIAQQLENVLLSKTTKGKLLHKVPMVLMNGLQKVKAVLKQSISMKIQVRRITAPKIHWVKINVLHLLKTDKERSGLLHKIINSSRIAPRFHYNISGSFGWQ